MLDLALYFPVDGADPEARANGRAFPGYPHVTSESVKSRQARDSAARRLQRYVHRLPRNVMSESARTVSVLLAPGSLSITFRLSNRSTHRIRVIGKPGGDGPASQTRWNHRARAWFSPVPASCARGRPDSKLQAPRQAVIE
jgi:hypothetical protein